MKWKKLVYFAKEKRALLENYKEGELLNNIKCFRFGKIAFYKSRKVEFIIKDCACKEEHDNIILLHKIIVDNFGYNKMYALIKYGLEYDDITSEEDFIKIMTIIDNLASCLRK